MVPITATGQGAVGLQDRERERAGSPRSARHRDDHVDQAARRCGAEAGRRQVERDGLAGDEVVGGEARESAVGRRDRTSPPAYGVWPRGPGRVRARARAAEWRRLEQLTAQRRLTARRATSSSTRYQQVATHLSVVRTSAPDAALVAYLSSILARRRPRTVGTRATTWRGVAGFFTERFPAALYRLRCGGSARWRPTCVVTGVMIWWLLGTPAWSRA